MAYLNPSYLFPIDHSGALAGLARSQWGGDIQAVSQNSWCGRSQRRDERLVLAVDASGLIKSNLEYVLWRQSQKNNLISKYLWIKQAANAYRLTLKKTTTVAQSKTHWLRKDRMSRRDHPVWRLQPHVSAQQLVPAVRGWFIGTRWILKTHTHTHSVTATFCFILAGL